MYAPAPALWSTSNCTFAALRLAEPNDAAHHPGRREDRVVGPHTVPYAPRSTVTVRKYGVASAPMILALTVCQRNDRRNPSSSLELRRPLGQRPLLLQAATGAAS